MGMVRLRSVPGRRGYPLEHPLQNTIVAFLRFRGFYVWRQNNHAVYDQKRGCYRRNPQARLGVSDILGILPDGRFLAIEVKSARGKPSDDQRTFLQSIKDNGGIAFVARTLEDVKRELNL
jgi:hypothetical protein